MMRWFCLILLCGVSLSFTAWSAEDEKDDSKKSPEEKLREEATKLLNAGDKRESLRGRFQLAPEAQDEQPYPKVIGIISDKSGVYQVMILDKEIKERLKIVNNREVTLLGRLMVKESGNYIISDEVYEANAVGPKAKKKRGGL